MSRRAIVSAAAAFAAAACGSDPVYYDQPRYGSAPYNSRVADYDYGRVVAIEPIGGGRTRGAGAVVGGIVGGVLGHQGGSGRGNDGGTAAGAVGGAGGGHGSGERREEQRHSLVRCFRGGALSGFGQ